MIRYSDKTFRFKNTIVTFSIEQDIVAFGSFCWKGIFQLYIYKFCLEIRRF